MSNTPNFKLFAQTVEQRFNTMSTDHLFLIELDHPEELWNLYLDAFPEGTNEIFRERRYYDGSYDRNVLRQIGHVVTVSADGTVNTLWDLENLEYPFDVVAKKLSEFVRSRPVTGVPLIEAPFIGHVSTTETLSDGSTIVWDHFHASIPERYIDNPKNRKTVDMYTTNIQMFTDSLSQLSISNVKTVQDLISSNSIYRGEEFGQQVAEYLKLVSDYEANPAALYSTIFKSFASRIRSSVIGTLIEDLNTYDLETAVKRYEAKVAPSNYKRPKALITQAMIDRASATVDELGLKDSLERRHATLSDVAVDDVIWVNRVAGERMKGTLDSLVSPTKKKVGPATDGGAPSIGFEDFKKTVLPEAEKLELFVETSHQSNLVTLSAGVNPDAPALFKWDNSFAWSYIGSVADSEITQRVKREGGNTDAVLRVSLSWDNSDDLDIHCHPARGRKIYFGNKDDVLDVDANAGRIMKNPVENMQFSEHRLVDGTYKFSVNQYSARSQTRLRPGFKIEVATPTSISTYGYKDVVTGTIPAVTVVVSNGVPTVVDTGDLEVLSGSDISCNVWGIDTQQFIEVSSVLMSPNYWGEKSMGNKHTFFILKDCKNPEPLRSIFNEYLRGDLDQHRKVFEVLASKSLAQPVDDQLSGVGFSSTKETEVTLRVTAGASQRLYKVKL